MFSPFIYYILFAGQGILSSYLAIRRGRDPFTWFALGFIFGIFGIAALFLLPPQKPRKKMEGCDESTLKSIQQSIYRSLDWFYLNGKLQPEGPFHFDDVDSYCKQGIITEKTYVWSEGMHDWQKAEDLNFFL